MKRFEGGAVGVLRPTLDFPKEICGKEDDRLVKRDLDHLFQVQEQKMAPIPVGGARAHATRRKTGLGNTDLEAYAAEKRKSRIVLSRRPPEGRY